MQLLSEVLNNACSEALEHGMFHPQHFHVSYKFQIKSPDHQQIVAKAFAFKANLTLCFIF